MHLCKGIYPKGGCLVIEVALALSIDNAEVAGPLRRIMIGDIHDIGGQLHGGVVAVIVIRFDGKIDGFSARQPAFLYVVPARCFRAKVPFQRFQ